MRTSPVRFLPFPGALARAILVLLVASMALLAGCRRSEAPQAISLPPTAVLSTRSSFAVITENLLRVREKPGKDAEVILHIRRGNVVEIISRTETKEEVEGGVGYWFLVDYSGLKGWVFGAYLQVVSSRAEAERLASALE